MSMRTVLLSNSCLSVICVLMVGGCGGPPTAPQDLDAGTLEGYGITIVSCSTETDPKSYFQTPFISFAFSADQATDRRYGVLTSLDFIRTVPLYHTGLGDFGGQPVGSVYALRLKPGDYMFMHVGLIENGHWGGTIRPPRCFRVTAGTVTYIGNLHFSSSSTWFDRDGNRATYRVDVKDMHTRDLPIILAKYPKIKSDQIRVSLMEGEQVGFTRMRLLMRGGRLVDFVEAKFQEGADMNTYQRQFEHQRGNIETQPSP